MIRKKITLLIIVVLSISTTKAQSIYAVGNDDGFSFSCYIQANNPALDIYAVGNDDGFGYSCVGGVGTEVPLPIELLNFIAYIQDNWVNLEWQTASELNNDYFTIEKSKTANNWIIVTTINGAGNSSNMLSYNTTDQTPYSGISYYRLKQTDFDGKYEYSAIRAVNLEQTTTEVIIYPNPTNNQITIQANKQELSHIKIYNTLGQDVTNRIKQLSKSDNKVVIDLNSLTSGLYTVKTRTTANMVYKQ